MLAIRADASQRSALEVHAHRVVPGDWWTIADVHLVEARLEFPGSILPVLPQGFYADVNCHDPGSPIDWTASPYTLFAASGDWDERAGIAALNGLTAWIAEILPSAVRLHAGLSTPDLELSLVPVDEGWLVSARY